MEAETLTIRILARILPLMPQRGWNTEEEAKKMVWNMDLIMEEEFRKETYESTSDKR